MSTIPTTEQEIERLAIWAEATRLRIESLRSDGHFNAAAWQAILLSQCEQCLARLRAVTAARRICAGGV